MIFADMMSKRFQKALETNLKKKTLTQENVDLFLKELRTIFLEADVNFKVAKLLISEIAKQAQGEFIEQGLDARTMMIKIVHEQLIKILGKAAPILILDQKPAVIMMVGLQGSGKTTTASKIANFVKHKHAKNPLLVACDIARPGAVLQLQTLGKALNISVYAEDNKNPVQIAENALKYADEHNFDCVIIDSAGRLHIDEPLMLELKNIKKKVHPSEILLVCDGMTGQDIINVATTFHQDLNLTGSIITKLDGSAKGGAALSISYLTGVSVKFLGTGEKAGDLEPFYPERMADRILGMGDVSSLLEKAQSVMSERDIQETMDRMMVGAFDLNDMINQMKQMQKMGKVSALVKMLPSLAPKISEEKIAEVERDLEVCQVIVNSTTALEREKPQLLRYPSRQERVLKGSGKTRKDLNKLLSQYERTKKVMDRIAGQIKDGKMPEIPGMEALMGNMK